MENKQYCVYKHVSPNGKIYIGQTCQKPEKRWNNGLGYRAHHPHFYSAIQKYGWNNFEHVIIADGLTKKEADWLEEYLIAFYETMNPFKGYNHTRGGDGVTGFSHTDEAKRKISEAQLGKIVSEETRLRMSKAQKGRVFSDETKRKMSEAAKGRKKSEEFKQMIAESNRKRVVSEETKRRIAESQRLRHERIKQLQKSA